MKLALAVMVLALAACGEDGEKMTGDIAVTYGTGMPKFDVGAAVEDHDDPAKMLVQLGTDEVNCDTYLDVFLSFDLPEGTFVYFSVDKAGPGTYAQTSVSAMRSNNNHTSINGATGAVAITAVEPRVTGTVTFTTTDEDVGTIAATGSFDVKRCF